VKKLRHRLFALVVVLIAVWFPRIGRAQSVASLDASRAQANISGWVQAPAGSFGDVTRPVISAEAAAVNTTYEVSAAPGFDAGIGVRIARHVSAGVLVSRFSKTGRGSLTAQVPHPFYFNRPRSVAGDANDLTRAETGVHAQVTWTRALGSRWTAAISGGPSWLRIDQVVVTSVAIVESYPFDTAAFSGAITERRSRSRVGFNVGGDLAYMLRPHVGVGFGASFSRARVPVTDSLTVTAGGIHAGGGLRLRF
jgi:hypothetical protein